MAPPLNDSSAVVKREYAKTQRLIESCLLNPALIDLFSLCVLVSQCRDWPLCMFTTQPRFEIVKLRSFA